VGLISGSIVHVGTTAADSSGHGNTLTLETWSNWYTPAHIIGGWDWKLRRKEMQPVVEPEPIQQIPYPAILPKEVGSQLTLF
jgi:hypothetical protein